MSIDSLIVDAEDVWCGICKAVSIILFGAFFIVIPWVEVITAVFLEEFWISSYAGFPFFAFAILEFFVVLYTIFIEN